MAYHPGLITLLTLLTFPLTFASPLGSQLGTIGTNTLFDDYPGIEASGVVWIPNSSFDGRNSIHGDGLLAGADDSGRVFMINPDDDLEYYLTDDLGRDLEGITFDPFLFQNYYPHVYVIDESGFDLIRYSYTLSPPHILTAIEECRTSLSGAMPCHPSNRGVESLTLYSKSTPDLPAEFLVGLQNDGIIYRVDATGVSTGACIDVTSAIGVSTDVAGSQYDPVSDMLYTVYGNPKRLAATNVSEGCLLGDWATFDEDYEGFTIRGNTAYISADNEPSRIDEFVWDPTYITSLKTTTTCTSSPSVCDFTPCESGGGGASACSAPSRTPYASPSSTPSSTTLLMPTVFLLLYCVKW